MQTTLQVRTSSACHYRINRPKFKALRPVHRSEPRPSDPRALNTACPSCAGALHSIRFFSQNCQSPVLIHTAAHIIDASFLIHLFTSTPLMAFMVPKLSRHDCRFMLAINANQDPSFTRAAKQFSHNIKTSFSHAKLGIVYNS